MHNYCHVPSVSSIGEDLLNVCFQMTCKLVFSYFDKDHTMTIPVKFWQHLQSGGGGVVSTNC